MSQKTFNRILLAAIVGLCALLLWVSFSSFPASSQSREPYLWDDRFRYLPEPEDIESEIARQLYEANRRKDLPTSRHLEGEPRNRPAFRCYDDVYTGNVICKDIY